MTPTVYSDRPSAQPAVANNTGSRCVEMQSTRAEPTVRRHVTPAFLIEAQL